MWLLNDLALGLYQCRCSLVTQVGKANYSKANQHPKLRKISVSICPCRAREQGKDVLLCPNSICLTLRNGTKNSLLVGTSYKPLLEVKDMAKMRSSRSPGSILSFPHLLGLSAKASSSHFTTIFSQLIWPPSKNSKYFSNCTLPMS